MSVSEPVVVVVVVVADVVVIVVSGSLNILGVQRKSGVILKFFSFDA